MPRFAIRVEYDGCAYSGWQRQPELPSTVQQTVEDALSRIADHSIEIICAGRTDAGVHALGQIFHFDSSARRSNHAWLAGGNTHLPDDIRLQQIFSVRDDFHARYDARLRHYRYLILNAPQPSALWRKRCLWHRQPLDVRRMQEAALSLQGEHDFSAFRAAECQSKSPCRWIEEITISRSGHWLWVDVIGNAFLHHMVRNIVGSLLPVGDCRRSVAWLETVLQSRDRRQAGATAPACGLYFYQVHYPLADGISGVDDWILFPQR